MAIPEDLKYTATHQWVRAEADGTATVGITFHAQEQLGDVVFVQHPALGSKVERGENCAVVESVKAASDIPAPVAGEIVGINQAVADAPERLNQDPYGAWLFRVRPVNAREIDQLLDADAYSKMVGAGVK
jgi:glycine cleavage system H protein